MKELPANRDQQTSLLHGLHDPSAHARRRRNGEGHSLRETLEELIEEHEEEGAEDRAEFTEEERELLLNALSFGELQVWDVMVPRSDVKAIGVGAEPRRGARRRCAMRCTPACRSTARTSTR